MILIAFLIGAALGAWRAKSKNGSRLDMLWYAAIFGIVAALLATLAMTLLIRAG